MEPVFIAVGAFMALAVSLAGIGARSVRTPWRTSHYENVLCTSMEIKLVADSDGAADRAEAAAWAEIRRMNRIMSGYDPGVSLAAGRVRATN